MCSIAATFGVEQKFYLVRDCSSNLFFITESVSTYSRGSIFVTQQLKRRSSAGFPIIRCQKSVRGACGQMNSLSPAKQLPGARCRSKILFDHPSPRLAQKETARVAQSRAVPSLTFASYPTNIQ